ncbi:6-phospho-beta-glucosidase [Ketogulonicigenium robustum]|uniref:Beta-glucosidase n=1 Tax=Ketogulonicigenium robustum TaxID=92947 RepID=A0A1W6NZI2_9RHOB|nr:GH1 family beta-glucosidase [Ketogulonicigenium robustum]ARO14581.1 6-phospho-beta-glucosidase [Ketogulonicigenium robustum]
MTLTRKDFPADFIFGAATAAYQIEGMAAGGCGPSHWDSFAATPGNVVGAQDGAVACDHYHRWPADLDLMAGAGLDAYRFSTSWVRVMPDGKTVNPAGLAFYDKLVDGMLARGLQPFQTLYHWDLPSALADKGGWANRDTAQHFADYAEAITRVIGDRVASIATLNEPWCVAWLSHFLGIHAPGLRDIRAASRAMHHTLVAHGMAVERLRQMNTKAPLGIVLNFEHADPASNSPADIAAAARQDAIYNRWFIEAITRQSYPDLALEGMAPHLPANWQDDMPLIGQKLDWLGVNYYTRTLQKGLEGAPWPATETVAGPLPKTDMGWEIFPQGLSGFLTRMARDYVGDLPIFVTENGMAHDDSVVDGAVHDDARTAYLTAHLNATRDAIAAGANVKGYFYWSLLDNYEWAQGYAKRFGMVHVDYATQKRTPKDSFHALAALAQSPRG